MFIIIIPVFVPINHQPASYKNKPPWRIRSVVPFRSSRLKEAVDTLKDGYGGFHKWGYLQVADICW